VHDLVETALDLLLGQSQDDAVDVDVLASGELGVEPCAQLDQGGHAPLDDHAADVRFVNPRHDPDERALAGPISTDDPQRRSRQDGQGHARSAWTYSTGAESPVNKRASELFSVV
jgi:hypothetical protein